jgi:hypothetical protein
MYSLAEVLHKTVAEIGDMSIEEFNGWIAYLRMRQKDGKH